MGDQARAALVATASLLAISLAISGAWSQSAPDPAPEIAPPAPALDQGETVVLDTISVTTTKTEEKAINVMGGVSVVTRGEIDRLQPSRISDVFLGVPGVTTQENQNDPGQAINIRGLQDFGRVNVLVDGARQNFQTSGHNANGTFYLDPELIGAIDVARGPVSTIYGSGAIGGVVLFRTRTIDDLLAPDEKVGVSQKSGVGTNGAGWLSSTQFGARLGTAADVFGQFVRRNTAQYNDGAGNLILDSGSDLTAGLMKLNVRPADGHEISGTALLQRFDFTNNSPSGVGARFHDNVKADTYTLGYRFQRPDMPLIDLNVKGYYTTTDNDLTFLRGSSSRVHEALGARPGDKANFNIETRGFDAYNTARFDAWGLGHALTVGIDGVQDNVKTFDNAGGFGSALTPSGERRLGGGFVQEEIRIGNALRVLGALRYDEYELQGGAFHSDGSHWSPRVTVGVTPIEGIELYGTYAEGYRAPAITETLIQGIHPFPAFQILPNPTLRPEVAHNVEAGVNVKYDDVFRPGDRFRAKATVFQNNVDDYIDIVELEPPRLVPFIPGIPASVCARAPRLCFPISDFQYQNIARAEFQGVELEAGYDWTHGFVTLAAMHIEGTNQETGLTLLSVPPDRISGTIGLRFLDQRLTIGTRITGVAAKNDAAALEAGVASEAYALVDLFASYQYNDAIRGDFTIQNLFDTQYTQYLNAFASPGLTAKFALTVKFASR